MNRLLMKLVYRAGGFAGRHTTTLALFQKLPGSRLLTRRLHSMAHTIEQGPAAGLRLVFGPSSWAAGRGDVESTVAQTFVDLLTPGQVVFDIGANVGFYSILAARTVGATGHVVSFEPQPRNRQTLAHNVALNGATNVAIETLAVSDSTGTIKFDAATSLTGRVTANGLIACDCISIDDYVRRPGARVPDVVKIDVEGHEAAVIAGMRTLLTEHRPVVLTELHGTNDEFTAAFDGLGYELRAIESDLPVNDAPWWVHVLCIPAAR